MFQKNLVRVWLGVILLSGMFLMGQEGWPPDPVVLFPDPGLQAAVREAINKPTGDILASDLVGLNDLQAQSRNITDLTGIQYCVDLMLVRLDDNQIVDISALSGLTDLQQIYLHHNQISDISALAGLTSLTDLYIFSNQISDISALSGLVNMHFLQLDNNPISDIQPLVLNPGMGAGDELFLTATPLSSLSCNTYRWELQARGVSVTVGTSCGL
jgi:Leucine-rich repeat (LRR) protein